MEGTLLKRDTELQGGYYWGGRKALSSSREQLWPVFPLITFFLLATVFASSGEAEKQRASLNLVDDNPVVVEGRGFSAGESVTLRTSIAGQQITRKVKADSEGKFSSQLSDANAECSPLTISAEGQRGGRAMVRRLNMQPCGMQVQP